MTDQEPHSDATAPPAGRVPRLPPVGRSMLFAALVFVAVAGGWAVGELVYGPAQRPALQTWATMLDQSLPVPEFTLTDQHGHPFTHANLEGHWTYLFFGYTSCPDVCPTALAALARMHAALGADAPEPRFVFVSIDPERDTPARLAGYVGHFDPAFVGLSGSGDAIAALAKPLGIYYKRREVAGGGYELDHTASLMLVGPDARLVAISSPPHDAKRLADDFRAISEAR